MHPGQHILRQNNSRRIANFLDFNGPDHLAPRIGGYFRLFVHGTAPLYEMYNSSARRSTDVLRALAAGQDIPSNSSIMPEIIDSPPSQSVGSLASSPNGLSSSE